MEMAEAFHYRGIHVTVIGADDWILAGALDEAFATRLLDEVRGLGIDVVLGERVACLGDEEGHVRSVGCDDQSFDAEIVIVAAGAAPNVELARNAGLRIGESGAVWVDTHQRTSAPNVYAAGDCAESVHRLSGKPVNIQLGTYANRQGRIAGRNIGGANEVFPGVLGTAITKVMDIEVARTGLTEREARDLGRDIVLVEFDANTAARSEEHTSELQSLMRISY